MDFKISYAICTNQRGGSTLLCEALQNTRLAGFPREYLLFLLQGESWWSKQNNIKTRDPEAFLHLIKKYGTTPNGVFGLKIMWNYFNNATIRLRQITEYSSLNDNELLHRAFPNLHYIFLKRYDKVLQAVSWAKAMQTGRFTSEQKSSVQNEPEFNFAQIDRFYNLIVEGEAGWTRYFRKYGIKPLTLLYEEFVASYEDTALQILDYLGVEYPSDIRFGTRRLKRQRDEINKEWAARYKYERGIVMGNAKQGERSE